MKCVRVCGGVEGEGGVGGGQVGAMQQVVT